MTLYHKLQLGELLPQRPTGPESKPSLGRVYLYDLGSICAGAQCWPISTATPIILWTGFFMRWKQAGIRSERDLGSGARSDDGGAQIRVVCEDGTRDRFDGPVAGTCDCPAGDRTHRRRCGPVLRRFWKRSGSMAVR